MACTGRCINSPVAFDASPSARRAYRPHMRRANQARSLPHTYRGTRVSKVRKRSQFLNTVQQELCHRVRRPLKRKPRSSKSKRKACRTSRKTDWFSRLTERLPSPFQLGRRSFCCADTHVQRSMLEHSVFGSQTNNAQRQSEMAIESSPLVNTRACVRYHYAWKHRCSALPTPATGTALLRYLASRERTRPNGHVASQGARAGTARTIEGRGT